MEEEGLRRHRGWDKPVRGQQTLLLAAWPWVNPPPEKSARSPYPADELCAGPGLQTLSL